ncbi:MAG: molybdopterin oxidoreductase family protein [Betaproteobacteria bacterium]|nr:MAG: molybdopterin oxidoreductase family protein [Betaproteobacteria bacterium]
MNSLPSSAEHAATPGATRIVKGACPHDCPDTCALEYHVADGKLIDVKGSATHSVTGGVLCTKVAKYPLRTYHPTRIKTPLKRVGAKGEGKFVPISWDEALSTIASKFKSIIAKHGAEAILPYSYAGNMGILQYASMDRRFFHALGASQLDRTICSSAGAAGLQITLGARLGTDVEAFAHSEAIILWGTNPITSNLHLWSRCQEAKRRGAKLIAIDPYRSLSAEKCHQWLAIKPGTDAALALAMMHVLIRDDLLDHEYIAKHTLGFAELKTRVAEWTPERAAAICGIPANEIEALAALYGGTKKAAIRLNYGMQRHGGGGMAVRTVACLPALTGAWTEASGGLLLSSSGAYPMNTAYLERPDLMPRDANGKPPRMVNMCAIGDALYVTSPSRGGRTESGWGWGLAAEQQNPIPLPASPLKGEEPTPIHALFVYNSNPAAVAPDGNKVLAGLAREDLFTVVHDIFVTDTARYADIVLPATTQPEHDDIHRSYGHYDIVLNRRAIEPVGESLANTELFRRLAKLIGLKDPCLSESDESMIAHAFDWNHPTLAGQAFDSLERDGFLRLNYPKKDGFITPFLNGSFGTPSGKCEFYSEALAKRGLDPLPNYTPPHESDECDLANEYPLSLNTPPARNFMNSTFANIEELAKPHGAPTLQIHPNDAARRGIANEARVKVWNRRGEMKLAAKITTDTREGVATILWGHWRDHPGAEGFVNDLTSQALTDFGQGATFYDCRIEVEIA